MKARPPSPAATLHTLYNRAARAFLLRQIPLVHSLLESAFALLHAPEPDDDLGPYRSKWDLLRITLETTVYASPPADLPDALRELLTQTPVALIIAAYRRSLALFTPRGAPQKASHIPSAIILTLVYSSLKLEAPDAGRAIVEDWLATRDNSDDANYRKTVEAYCLYVLPKLEQWEYASEFLDYESELSSRHARGLHAQAIASRLPRVPPSPTVPPPRPYSPTPSSSSSSSSLSSTASMHTVVPATPRARSNLKPSKPRTVSSYILRIHRHSAPHPLLPPQRPHLVFALAPARPPLHPPAPLPRAPPAPPPHTHPRPSPALNLHPPPRRPRPLPLLQNKAR
ncbi:hypothetical protein B0H14DRAFT_2569121 [Mycena olivaceomarginata]|nr:hypothetical protein B0H14DRAFT_2569121 [Mycena olivaceomarginata]